MSLCVWPNLQYHVRMLDTRWLAALLLVTLAAAVWYLLRAEGAGQSQPPLLDRVASPQRLPDEFASGQSRFSQGTCATDADCQVSGCSGEVCGREATITTCEYSPSFPSERRYQCGCVVSVCGWRTRP